MEQTHNNSFQDFDPTQVNPDYTPDYMKRHAGNIIVVNRRIIQEAHQDGSSNFGLNLVDQAFQSTIAYTHKGEDQVTDAIVDRSVAVDIAERALRKLFSSPDMFGYHAADSTDGRYKRDFCTFRFGNGKYYVEVVKDTMPDDNSSFPLWATVTRTMPDSYYNAIRTRKETEAAEKKAARTEKIEQLSAPLKRLAARVFSTTGAKKPRDRTTSNEHNDSEI